MRAICGTITIELEYNLGAVVKFGESYSDIFITAGRRGTIFQKRLTGKENEFIFEPFSRFQPANAQMVVEKIVADIQAGNILTT